MELDPLLAARGEAANPPDMLMEHDEAGTLAVDRQTTDTPGEMTALVKQWWDRTAPRTAWTDAVDQTEKDRITLTGEDPKREAGQKEDGFEITVNHVYRNAIQTVAALVPDQHAIRWEPREVAEPLPGQPVNTVIVQIKQRAEGLASVLGILCRRYGEEIQLQEVIEAWVQDACHFRISVLKIIWQGGSDRARQALSKGRMPDELTKLERFLYLNEAKHRGEFTDNDAQWQEMKDLMITLKIDKADVRTGLLVEVLNVADWRCDPRVTGPQNVGTADWMRHDTYMTRAEILGQWQNIDPDDLTAGIVYIVDEYGRAAKRDAEDQQRVVGQARTTDTGGRSRAPAKDDDLLLVAEIWDQVGREVWVLVEGLEYPAVRYNPTTPLETFYPFVPLVMNRNPNGLYGFSDTELQAKLQAAVNRMRTGEENARLNAQPRYAYNAATIGPEDAKRIANAEPHEFIPLPLGKDDIRSAIMPLVSSHAFHPEEHDTAKLMDEMRRMSGQTEEATGGNGNPEFSSQVQVAAAGANLLGSYRKKRIDRGLTRAYDIMGQYLLFNLGQVPAQRMAGPMVAQYWPQKPVDRQSLYQALGVKVVANIDAAAADGKRLSAIGTLLDTAAKNGVRLPVAVILKLMAKIMGEQEVADLMESDPNALIGDLAQTVQENGPQSVTPEAMQILMQLAQQLAPYLAAAQAQAAAAAQPGQGDPAAPAPVPADAPAPMAGAA